MGINCTRTHTQTLSGNLLDCSCSTPPAPLWTRRIEKKEEEQEEKEEEDEEEEEEVDAVQEVFYNTLEKRYVVSLSKVLQRSQFTHPR